MVIMPSHVTYLEGYPRGLPRATIFYYTAVLATEQFNLASNAQKGKIFKSNVTTIKVK